MLNKTLLITTTTKFRSQRTSHVELSATSTTVTGPVGPATWNCLPLALRSLDLSDSAFKRPLKTHLFSTARHHWDVLVILAPHVNIQTYLLICCYRPVIGSLVCVCVDMQDLADHVSHCDHALCPKHQFGSVTTKCFMSVPSIAIITLPCLL